METLGELRAPIFAALWLSWIAVPIALIPVVFVAMSGGADSRWKIPSKDGSPASKVHYVWLGVLGGLAGEFSAVISLFLGTWWACRQGDQLCHDGQAGTVLILTIPVLSFLGSSLSLVWTWFSLGMKTDSPWTSLFRFNGPNRLINLALAAAVQFVFWPLFVVLIARATLF